MEARLQVVRPGSDVSEQIRQQKVQEGRRLFQSGKNPLRDGRRPAAVTGKKSGVNR